MRPAGGDDGFTLVDTLASLTLLAMLSLLLVMGAQAGRLRLARIDQAGQGETIEAAQTLLRARIERSFPLTTLLTPEAVIDFNGQYNEMAFTAPAPQSRAPDALYHYRLALGANGDLTLDSSSDLAGDAGQAQDHLVLLRRVASLDIAYFGPPGPGGAGQWVNHWDQQPNLPRLVRVRLDFAPEDRRQWPDLIVRPASTLDSACAIDPHTSHCRGR
jgi:hypothetical protein